MKCEHPLATHGMLHGCGQCMPCRINKQRVWAHRLELEATQHVHNCFLTLTYDDENLPKDGSLDAKALQDFIKRLRRRYEPLRIRYFACGEYGDLSWRPHYHAVLFGFPTCVNLQTEYRKDGGIKCCGHCRKVEEIWGMGRVQLARAEPQSLRYVCGYVTKKMTQRTDPRLHGKVPEFSRMSLKPGIGHSAMETISDNLPSSVSLMPISSISYGNTPRPLGRYLTRKLNTLRGLSPGAHVQNAVDALQAEMLPLRILARKDEQNPSFTTHYKKKMEGKYASQQVRLTLRKHGNGKKI